MTTNNYNPFHEKSIDTTFRVKSQDAKFKEVKSGKEKAKAFFQGVGKFGKKAAQKTGRAAVRINKANQRIGPATRAKLTKLQAARVQHLRRRQEISEYKTNLLNLKHQKAIHKSNILSAKVATVEQRRALREAKKGNRHVAPLGTNQSSSTGVLDNTPRTIKRGPLSDRGGSGFKVNLKGRKKGGFFS